MLTMTIAQTAKPRQAPTPRQIRRRAKALGWTQNSLARRAGKFPSFVSSLLNRRVRSPGVYLELVDVLEMGEATDGKMPPDPGPK